MRLRSGPPARGSFPNAILTRMRRRTARVGFLVAAMTTLLAAAVVFAVCACKSVR